MNEKARRINYSIILSYEFQTEVSRIPSLPFTCIAKSRITNKARISLLISWLIARGVSPRQWESIGGL